MAGLWSVAACLPAQHIQPSYTHTVRGVHRNSSRRGCALSGGLITIFVHQINKIDYICREIEFRYVVLTEGSTDRVICRGRFVPKNASN